MSSKPRVVSGVLSIKLRIPDTKDIDETQLIAEGLINEVVNVLREAAKREGIELVVNYGQITY